MKTRRNGKSILPSLLKEYGFDKGEPKKEESIIITFNEYVWDISHLPIPIIKSGKVFTYYTPIKDKE